MTLMTNIDGARRRGTVPTREQRVTDLRLAVNGPYTTL